MDTKDLASGSKGILVDIMEDAFKNEDNKEIQEQKNIEIREYKNVGTQEIKKKRTYSLKTSTIMKLTEMKLTYYPDNTDLGDIVDEAICKLHKILQETK